MTIENRVYQTITQNQDACVDSYTVAFMVHGRRPEQNEVKQVSMAIKRLREKGKILRVAHWVPNLQPVPSQ